ncbi:MspA family porin [Nocardia huaxiensis]|uniref:MspA family porin n=1 Tax=Nocardia huaxiensis TaxID=2755382 RepID=A0A7D6ZRM7_9NOCA|nr:MspA family porin [Nocardia huaxiensis]QLY32145.1 MspA family porin [Nocardia huaxiensis]UFS95727.1 MspA family porin [Nocardia huaxiensis]
MTRIFPVGGRLFGTALAVAVLACGFAAPGPAAADTFIPLPGGVLTKELPDGTMITLRIADESAKISGSMGATPLHRNVWVTGVGSIDLEGPSAATSTIKISPGYVVGCQVDISSLGLNENAGESNTLSQTAPYITPSLSESFGGGITLGPGQAAARLMLDLEKPDDYGMESHKRYNKVPGPHASVTWIDETFEVNGCGGYAQARSFILAEVDTTTFIGNLALWGQPFSMG